MFLEKTIKQNTPLVDFAFYAHRKGLLLPDTYIIDLDTLCENAKIMLASGERHKVKLYFMLKQLGRNPRVAQKLDNMGFAGAVCVDYREALTMIKSGIKLGNVGHLVQTPYGALEQIIGANPEIITVYSVEKAKEVGEIAKKLGKTQDIMLRIIDKGDYQYSGQYAGFKLEEIEETAKAIAKISGVNIAGVSSFPCFIFDEKLGDILPTHNLKTVVTAAARLGELGYNITQINTPSATCSHSIPKIAAGGGTHAEPGHGLSGTTPYHAVDYSAVERPAFVYLSEVSHNFGGLGYCYGGGHYRRSHMHSALVGSSFAAAKAVTVTPPTDESIDYHFALSETVAVSHSVVMSFRTQIFVTRSEVALVSGLLTNNPKIEGIYSSLGSQLG